jgi:hypothetical protein
MNAPSGADGGVQLASVWQVDGELVCCDPCGSMIGPGIYEVCCEPCGTGSVPASGIILIAR